MQQVKTGEDLSQMRGQRLLGRLYRCKLPRKHFELTLSRTFSHHKAESTHHITLFLNVNVPFFAHQQPVEMLTGDSRSVSAGSQRSVRLRCSLWCIIWQIIKSSSWTPACRELTGFHWLKHLRVWCVKPNRPSKRRPFPQSSSARVSTPSVFISPCGEFKLTEGSLTQCVFWMSLNILNI